MTTFARLIAFLLGLAAAGCAFLPWVGDVDAWHLTLASLLSPARSHGAAGPASIGLAVCAGALVVVVGAFLDSRTLVIVGGLVVVAFPAVWVLGNAVASGGVPMSQVQLGAFGAAATGLMTLVLAAVAADTRVPTAR